MSDPQIKPRGGRPSSTASGPLRRAAPTRHPHYALAEQPGVLTSLSARRSWVRIPPGAHQREWGVKEAVLFLVSLPTPHSIGPCRRGRVEGSCLINRPMPVRIRPSALPEREAPLECDGRHATLRRSKSRFDSWQGQCSASRPPRVWRNARRSSKPPGRVRFPGGGWDRDVLGVCRNRTRPCEGRGPGSTPGEDIPRDSRPGPDRETGSARGKTGLEGLLPARADM